MQMDAASQEKTAFFTYSGLYEFKKISFGLVNAPAKIYGSGLARDGCLAYLDDLLVVEKTFEEHNNNLVKVFERLKSAGLTLSQRNAQLLAQMEVHYLGHIVYADGQT